jgi:UDP-glucuronate 4-epimerase
MTETKSKKHKILLTGHDGFLGNNLLSILEREYQIVKFLGDIRDVENIKKQISPDLDGVIHLAGVISGSDKIFIEVNIVGTMNLLEVLRDKSPNLKFFISIGSASEYGPHNKKIEESDNCNPNSMYGHSKLIATELVRSWQRYTNIPSVILRPFNIIGPNQPPRMLPSKLAGFFSQKKEKVEIHNVNKDAVRDWVDVEDVSKAILLLSKSKLEGFEIFNLGLSENITNEELIKTFSKVWNKKFSIGETIYPPDKVVSKSTKITNFLNWKPENNLEDSIKKIHEALKVSKQK